MRWSPASICGFVKKWITETSWRWNKVNFVLVALNFIWFGSLETIICWKLISSPIPMLHNCLQGRGTIQKRLWILLNPQILSICWMTDQKLTRVFVFDLPHFSFSFCWFCPSIHQNHKIQLYKYNSLKKNLFLFPLCWLLHCPLANSAWKNVKVSSSSLHTKNQFDRFQRTSDQEHPLSFLFVYMDHFSHSILKWDSFITC